MSKTIAFFLDRPHLVEQLPPKLKAALLAAVREQLANMRNGGLPQSAMEAMSIDNKLWADIAADGRRNNSPGWLKPVEGPAVERGTGWSVPAPLTDSIPGLKYVDQQIDVADAVDRHQLEAKLGHPSGGGKRRL